VRKAGSRHARGGRQASEDYEGGMTHAAMAAPIGTPSASTATAMISLVAWLSTGSSSSAMVGSTMARHAVRLDSSALKGSLLCVGAQRTVEVGDCADAACISPSSTAEISKTEIGGKRMEASRS
jgi:hypothetical protein